MKTLELPTIKSQRDAYAVADKLDRWLLASPGDECDGIWLNNWHVYKTDSDGAMRAHAYGLPAQRYYPCELADFVLWPNRKIVNDAIRTHYQ